MKEKENYKKILLIYENNKKYLKKFANKIK